MWCRALLAAAVLSYVLCVLLLSGVQKEDIDAGTLRKLQRHNVNIDDINDRQVQERCLGKTDIPINLTTLQANPTTEKTATERIVTGEEIPNETYKYVGSLSGDSMQLQKIVEYLVYKQKEDRRKALESKDTIRKSILASGVFTTLPSRSSSIEQPRRIKIEDPTTESVQKIVIKNNDVEFNKASMNKELEQLMKVWQTKIDRMSETTKQESTTIKIMKDDVISKNTKDIEYITKIVSEIMSKRQFNDVKTSTTIPKLNSNLNETFRNVEQALGTLTNNQTFLVSEKLFNSCRLENLLTNKAGGKDKSEMFENLTKQLSYDVNNPVPNTNPNDGYVICKKIESKQNKPTQRIDEYTLNYILNKLKKEGQGINVLNSGSTKIASLLENKPKNIVYNTPSGRAKDTNAYKANFNLLDSERAKLLQTALENQSKGTFFNPQSGQVKLNDNYNEIMNQMGDQAFETRLQNQPKIQHFYNESDRSKKTDTFKEKHNNYPKFVEENKSLWAKYVESLRNKQDAKLEDELTKAGVTPPIFRYNPAKEDNGLEEEYKRWLFRYHNPSNKQEPPMEIKPNSMLNSRPDDNEKSTKILNRVQYHSNRGKQYKRPWLYGGLSNEQFRPKIQEKEDEVLFKPKNKEKIADTIDPRLENEYGKKWTPYFQAINNNTSNIQIEELETPKNNHEPVLIDPNGPQIIQSNDRDISREVMDDSKNYPNYSEWYPYQTPFAMANGKDKQFKPKENQKMYQVDSLAQQNKNDQSSDAEFKYFGNKQIKKQKPKMEEERDEETEYFINSKSNRQNNYQYPPIHIPYEENVKKPSKNEGTTTNRHSKYVVKEKLSKDNEKKDNTKFPPFPPNVIKDIADSVKEIVLRDLKTTTILPATTTQVTTTRPTTTTPTTTTTTKPTTTTSPTTTGAPTTRITKPAIKSTTTEGTLMTTKDPLKIQDASKALEKIMEIFEKISSIKDKMVTLDNVKNYNYVNNESIVQKLEQPVQYKPESPFQYALNSAQSTRENRLPYGIQALQLNTDNRIPHDPQSLQFKTENHVPYRPEAAQINAGNTIPYNSLQHLQLKAEHRVPYEPQGGQIKAENLIPYNQQAVNIEPGNHVSYDSQAFSLQTQNRLPFNPIPLQFKPENNIPYDPQSVQIKSENRIPYDPPPPQKPENRIPYDYSAKSPYYRSKVEYNHMVKSKPNKAPRTYAITVQTNSGEIAPLKIAVKKPLVQNIVLTTKSPVKEENSSDEYFMFGKPKPSTIRRQTDKNKESEVSHAREKKPFVTRHTHRDTYSDIPKSRKVIKQREFNEEYKPRDMQTIERFHEKLERGDAWPRYEEEKIAQRMQRPLVKKTNYDDTHFRNFLKTQQKVNAMLEKILGAAKNKPGSSEVV